MTRFSVGCTEIIDGDGHPGDFTHSMSVQAISLCLGVVLVLLSDIKMYTYFSTIFVIIVLTILGTVGFFLVESYLLEFSFSYDSINSSGFRFW